MKFYHLLFVLSLVRLVKCDDAIIASPDDNVGPSHFEIATQSRYFLDKTRFLKVFLQGARNDLITSPRYFCKSTNVDMARRFFQYPYDKKTGTPLAINSTNAYKLFTNKTLNLRITREDGFFEEYFGKFVVIYFNFTDIQGTTKEEILTSVRQRLRSLFLSFEWLYKKFEGKVMIRSLKNPRYEDWKHNRRYFKAILEDEKGEHLVPEHATDLLTYIKAYFKQREILILVDDYDYPIMRSMNLGIPAYAVNKLIISFLGAFTATVIHPAYGMIVGLSRRYKRGFSMISDLLPNITYHYFMLREHRYADFFSFTDIEVERLLTSKKIGTEEKYKVKKYLDGYMPINEKWLSFYNPKGVLRYMETNEIDYSILQDRELRTIMRCLNHEQFFHEFSFFLSTKEIKCRLHLHLGTEDFDTYGKTVRMKCATHNVDSLIYVGALYDRGYFINYNETEYAFNFTTLRIANQMAEDKIRNEFLYWYRTNQSIEIVNSNVASSLRAILASDNTTQDTLTNLERSLNELLAPRVNGTITRVEFKSLMFGAVFLNLDHVEDVKITRTNVKDIKWPTRTDELVFTNNNRRILVIARVSYKKELAPIVKRLRRYVPYEKKGTTSLTLIKYLAINMNQSNYVQIETAKRRYIW